MSATNSKQLSNNNLTIIMVLITLLVLGGSVLIGKALLASIMRDTKVVAAKNKADKQLKDDLDAAPKLVSAFSALGQSANTLADALPTTSDFPGLIVLLENISNDSGVALKGVTPNGGISATGSSTTASAAPTAPTASSVTSAASSSLSSATGGSTSGTTTSSTGSSVQSAPQAYNFSIEFDGSYAGLLKMLADLQTSARPIRIVGLQLAGTGAQLSGTLTMQTFYQDKAQLPFSTETIK